MTSPSARSVALEAIRRVIDEGAYSNRTVPALLARSGLEPRDRAFATELAYGTLRHLIPLDRAIQTGARRPVSRISPGALHVTRLGAYQLLVARVAPHAAVSETVSLAGPRERGFVNAVLRRLAEDPPPPPPGNRDEDVAGRTGLTPWAVGELRRIVGDEAEEAAAALASRAPLSLRANGCVTSADELVASLAREGIEAMGSDLDPDCLLVTGGDPTTLPGFAEGRFAVQDQASAFVVRVLDPRPGERVLDACAAPGGKAAFAACLVGTEGTLVAADVHPARARLIADTGSRLRVRVLTVCQDATAPAAPGPFDRVLVDAPCSGIGSARRRPELLWRPAKGMLSGFARRQVAIAAASADLLTAGGRLVYSVCTFPRAETDAAADAILRHRPFLRPIETPGPDGTAERHRLWPHRHGSDGMFVAAFERVA
jgi:16S rRNA (cytosine967-C5)-methyltransferase